MVLVRGLLMLPWLSISPAAANSMDIVIANGPQAGTYKLPAANMICMNVKARKLFSAAYKDSTAQDATVISGTGVNVFNPDEAGPKRGEITIRFGDPDEKRPAAYNISIARDSKNLLTMKKSGKVAEVAFDGQTKTGAKLRVLATCTEIEEF